MLAGIADNSEGAVHTAVRAARGNPPAGVGGELLFAHLLGVRSGDPLQSNRRAGRNCGQGVFNGGVNRGMGIEVVLKLADNADAHCCHELNAATRNLDATDQPRGTNTSGRCQQLQ